MEAHESLSKREITRGPIEARKNKSTVPVQLIKRCSIQWASLFLSWPTMNHVVTFLLGILFIVSCSSKKPLVMSSTDLNVLTTAERALGWESLFNGKDMSKWRQYKKEGIDGWKVENDEMIALGIEGLSADIITKETFENFELSIEWNISERGNSGIFFNVREEDHLNYVYESGPEYQLLDDESFRDQLKDWQETGANYAMHPPMVTAQNPRGTYNHTRVIVDEGKVQHWLNDILIVQYELWTPEWEALKESGKWKDYPDYGKFKSGHIALQDHGNQINFRNIKIRRL